MGMKTKLGAALAALMLVLGTAACSGGGEPSQTPIGGDVIAPITMEAGELQGARVDLLVGQALNIDTGDLPVDSYSGEVADTKVAKFVPGKTEAGAEFNPGVTGLAPGTTKVTMKNRQGGIQPLEFTITVKQRS